MTDIYIYIITVDPSVSWFIALWKIPTAAFQEVSPVLTQHSIEADSAGLQLVREVGE